MSLAVLRSRALSGIDAPAVSVEVHLANGLPSFTIVGLPDTEVKESKDRVRAAIQNSRFEFPARRITVNLAPADLPKESGRFDLAIALGILAASRQIPHTHLDAHEFAGELSLSGDLRPIRGALAMAYALSRNPVLADGDTPLARAFVLPAENAAEAALVSGTKVLPARTLIEVCDHLSAPDRKLAAALPAPVDMDIRYPDLADVRGQPQARRALEVAAAGGHSMLMIGPPGTGKSMLAQRFPGLLPDMSDDEALSAAAVMSLTTRGFDARRWKVRPFRSPHHTASAVAMVGGGNTPRPGEISLAHQGVLFLDELPEFERRVLEVLREPLETGHITISRAAHQTDFPASFQLIAAMNPCPCGYRGHPLRACRCTPDQVERYQARISGPLLDRIDVQIEVPTPSQEELLDGPPGEPTLNVAERVSAAHARQLARQGKRNALLGGHEIDLHCSRTDAADGLLRHAMTRFSWSARAYARVLKLARTIADLAGDEQIDAAHVGEAIQYRRGVKAD
ncbi:YifB family Mg chelatase-like AAA ATPase [Ralstonia sp. GX3-BWBA]|uniref:YifB family Mg chelatase-like AAA ATPase n=1 Tax=Ralstonia sp. GX3-BWBA TaxID=2219865 RepID=UPI000DD3C7D1|nr:YifB family Mg chelatase-like AAA ATPase [Ralstonia sp. GX3-BWBA]